MHCFAGHEETELALRLSGALWWYWFMRGYYNEALHWLVTALNLPKSSGRTAARANALAAAGYLMIERNDLATAQTFLKESMALYQELEDTRGYAHAVQFLGAVYANQGDYATARPLIEQGLALCRDMRDTWHVAFGLNDLAYITSAQGDEEAARALWDECIAYAREIGERWALPRTLLQLVLMAVARGDDVQAMALLQECLTITREMGDLDMLGFLLLTLAQMVMRRDDAEAERLVQEGLTFAREIGDQGGISHGLYLLGEIARIRGDTEQASGYYRESLALALERRNSGITGHETKVIIGWCLLGGARAASKSGSFWRAARFLGAAETQLNISRDLNPAERAEYERNLADLRSQLGDVSFVTARDEGYTMTPRQALIALESPSALELLTEPNPHTIASTRSPSTKAPGYPAGLAGS